MAVDAKYQDVLAVVRECAGSRDGGFDIDAILIPAVSRSLGLSFTDEHGLWARSSEDSLRGQVRRALGTLVAEGALMREGTGREVLYYPPEAYETLILEREKLRRRTEALESRLLSLGITGASVQGDVVMMSLGTAEQLAELASR